MRKTATITISAEGRDKGKSFLITEMPAAQAERWAMRLLSAMAHSNVDLPRGALEGGIAAFAQVGIRLLVGVRFHEIEPLLAEMMECVQFIPDLTNPKLPPHGLIDTVIEEMATRFLLRDEVIKLHTGFSVAGALSTSTSSPAPSTETASS